MERTPKDSTALVAEKQDERKSPVTQTYLRKAALFYLERYASSAETLRKVLQRKVERRCREVDINIASLNEPIDPTDYYDMVDDVVAACQSSLLVDDSAFAHGKVASMRRRGTSERMIRAKLAAKGIDGSTLATALEEHEGDDREAALAYAKRRKLGPFRITDREAHRLKDIAKLGRAGFSSDIARSVIDAELGEEHDEL